MLPSRGTSAGWINELMGTPWSLRKGSAKSCTWTGIICALEHAGAVWLESSFAKRVLQILVDNKLPIKQWSAFVAKRASSVWGALGRDFVSRLREVILPLYSAQVRSWNLKCRRELELLERVQ